MMDVVCACKHKCMCSYTQQHAVCVCVRACVCACVCTKATYSLVLLQQLSNASTIIRVSLGEVMHLQEGGRGRW